jgi:phosphatidylglycerol:prolipoprotein diacylglycerol transferase
MYPVLFKIGSFEVPSYGVMLVVAFIAAYFFGRARAAKYGLTKDQIGDAFVWTLIFGVLGARLGFILQELPHYLEHTDQLFSLRFQGLTSFGGLIAGFVTLVFLARKWAVPLRDVLDVAGAPMLLGHAIGRVGCLLHGCCYGGRCDLPWGIPVQYQEGLFHPAQIYDSLMVLAGLGILLLAEKRGLRPGQSVSLAIILYSASRFIYEFWRAGTFAEVKAGYATSTYFDGLPVTEAQIFSLACILVAGFFFLKLGRRPEAVPTAETP